MIARLTLRGLDSALLPAKPGYSPASIALFDSRVCLRARSGVPPLSRTLNPVPPHHHPSENQAPQAERRRRGVAQHPGSKTLRDKGRKKKGKDGSSAAGLTQRWPARLTAELMAAFEILLEPS
ncbi:unnamed protein product [Pleuronectes platessa]|uniref:Uncharacterized protein n=1 Tax=Pleuronectes platessa TaxID=8262 RepID=A0A9N7Z880_PLEPL|nr:unnamed protein product [Pleuronectes platessa]